MVQKFTLSFKIVEIHLILQAQNLFWVTLFNTYSGLISLLTLLVIEKDQ